jgi:hypothetical protein
MLWAVVTASQLTAVSWPRETLALAALVVHASAARAAAASATATHLALTNPARSKVINSSNSINNISINKSFI